MKTRMIPALILSLFISFAASRASAALEPSQVRAALPKKTESYLRDGVITGGDREIHSGIVKDVRRATNGGFERIVIDLDAEKAPYYQAAIDPTSRRILVTIFGSPKLAINAKKIVDQFRASPLVARVEFFPLVEEDSWTFALYLKAAVPVEVFELTAPTRIIFDLKAGAALIGELAPKGEAPMKKTTARAAVSHAKPARKARPKPKPIQVVPDDGVYEGNGAASHSEDIPE